MPFQTQPLKGSDCSLAVGNLLRDMTQDQEGLLLIVLYVVGLDNNSDKSRQTSTWQLAGKILADGGLENAGERYPSKSDLRD